MRATNGIPFTFLTVAMLNYVVTLKALADYIHNKDLKFGVYSARCRYTCQLFAASFGHEAIDAQQWAE